MEKLIKNDNRYLSTEEFADGISAERTAYLIRIRRRVDRNGYPFLMFYLKTIDRAVIAGFKFRVEESASIGTDILTLNRTMVTVKFDVQIYNGAYSLLIREITLLPKEDASPFFETYSRSDEVFNNLNRIAADIGASPLNYAFKTASLFSIQYGLSGAYVELIDMVYNIIISRHTKHTEDVVKCFFGLVNPYFQYLVFTEKIEFLPKREILELLHSVTISEEDRLTSIVEDALSALMNLGKPEHLYSHIIFNAFKTARVQMNIEDAVISSPKNLVINMEGDTLIYY